MMQEKIDEQFSLKLVAFNQSLGGEAVHIESPVWPRIEQSLVEAFEFGGFVRLYVLQPEDSSINFLAIESCRGKYRLVMLANSTDPKEEYMEWWGRNYEPYRGSIRLGDDDADARTVLTDITIAREVFFELFNSGKLSELTLSGMRSPWNPMPE